MNTTKNILIPGKHNKPILTDICYLEDSKRKPIIVFCHGYKGFKDWGAWNMMAEEIAKQGFCFIKFNFAYNGGTVDQPIDFPDLEAFGNNNFLIELDDLDSVITWVQESKIYSEEMNKRDITLIGHSRGGGIVLLKSASDNRISRVITWASVSDFASRFPSGEQLQYWQENGVAYITNARTNQQMPHYFQFYTSFKENEALLTIKTAVEKLSIPVLFVHGALDETVSLSEAEQLNSWNKDAQLSVIVDGNHSFGSAQPWTESVLPKQLSEVLEKSISFMHKSSSR